MDTSAFHCLDCHQPLSMNGESNLTCSACKRSWPIRDGIPRFFDPPYYWGEVPLEQAEEMVEEARREGWRQTVARRFAASPEMQVSLTDWQRASWLPLLALPENSLALDIGSGYGALTQSLSRAAGTVYSLEAVPQRLAFTSVRLEQEGITNVRLLQGSALQLPFRDGLFDLVVVNGVLEWVGSWVDEGDPRNLQVEFLKKIRRMLKPSGMVMIGIENRIGFAAIRGTIDHSGLSYTSLMPRWFASLYMRQRHFRSYRFSGEQGRKKLQYRTYTYTEKGYRKLLEDSGLPGVLAYWSDPGYNQPYHLISLENTLPSLYLRKKHYEPVASPKRDWKTQLKQTAANSVPLSRAVCSDFIFFAGTAADPVPPLWTEMRRQFPKMPDLKQPVLTLHSKAFGPKNVIHVYEKGSTQLRCILRTTTPGPVGVEEFEQSYRNLEIAFQHSERGNFSAPQPYGYWRQGWFHYAAESVVEGTSLAERAFSSASPGELLKEDLPLAIECAVKIADRFPPDAGICPVPRRIPSEFDQERGVRDMLDAVVSKANSLRVQHGDFTIENVLLGGAQPAVIDWEYLMQGGPALYDVFSLLVSALPATPLPAGEPGSPWLMQFESVFFGQGEWTKLYAKWIQNAADALNVSDIWSEFLDFLLLRYHNMIDRAGAQGRHHGDFLRIAARSKDQFLCKR